MRVVERFELNYLPANATLFKREIEIKTYLEHLETIKVSLDWHILDQKIKDEIQDEFKVKYFYDIMAMGFGHLEKFLWVSKTKVGLKFFECQIFWEEKYGEA